MDRSTLGQRRRAVLDAANLSLSDALTGMTAALMDAIRDFDGSPEQLQNIGLMVSAVREGEIKLLSQIDAIQKGIQANLETLRAEMLGLRGPSRRRPRRSATAGTTGTFRSTCSRRDPGPVRI